MLMTVRMHLLWQLALSTMDLIDNGKARCGMRPKSPSPRGKESSVWFDRFCASDVGTSTPFANRTDIASAIMLNWVLNAN
jgi:hypothetical protein